MSAGAYRALDFIRALLEPSNYYSLLSPVELINNLTGLAKIWARIVLGIGLIYCKLFIRPGLSSQGRVPVPAVVQPALNDFNGGASVYVFFVYFTIEAPSEGLF